MRAGNRCPRSGSASVCQGVGEIIFGGGDDAAQLRHRAAFRGEAGDVDQQAAQQLACGVVPVGFAVGALGDDQHIGETGGTADHIGIVGIEGVEPVEVVRGAAGDVERVDEDDVVAHAPARASGDGIGLALEVQHEGRAGILEQVRDDAADSLSGAGGGAGEQMAVLSEPTIGAARRIAHDAEHEGIGGRRRRQMACGIPRRPEMGGVSPNRRKFRQAGFRSAERPASGNFPVFDGWRGAIR